VTLYRSLAYAGDGGALGGWPAGAAEILGPSELYAFQCLFEGGAGGDGDDWIAKPCASGGPGLFLAGSASGWELACVFSGGAGALRSARCSTTATRVRRSPDKGCSRR